MEAGLAWEAKSCCVVIFRDEPDKENCRLLRPIIYKPIIVTNRPIKSVPADYFKKQEKNHKMTNVQLKSASISHVNSQSLVFADYGVKTGYCQLLSELVCCAF
jgi:hypothetical protein